MIIRLLLQDKQKELRLCVQNSLAIPVYGSNGIVGQHTEALIEEPCIVIGRKGSAGALNKSLNPSWTTDVSYYVIPPKEIDFDYIFLALKSLNLDSLGKGIKPGLNRNDAYSLVTALPPLEEQKRIVAKVDELMKQCSLIKEKIGYIQKTQSHLATAIVERAIA